MKITGIITEYNPLHNGHVLHINKSKELNSSDAIVCVMSGNFVQRGLPAIIDKWTRAEMAIKNGVDLVLELPTIYSLSSAEFFAHGSVSLLNSLGCIHSICFGSEHGSVHSLMKIASILVSEPLDFTASLKKYLSIGKSYPSARTAALLDYFKDTLSKEEKDALTDMLNSSNNILGIEYCKSLLRLKSSIIPSTIQREGSSYNSTSLESSFSSATSIRSHIFNKGTADGLQSFVPPFVYEKISSLEKEGYCFTNPDSAFHYLKYRILSNKDAIKNLPDCEEGLENTIYNAFTSSSSLSDAVEKIKSKRYTFTRIYRLLFQLYLGFDSFDYDNERRSLPNYIRVLGFNSKGKEILNKLKKESELPLISNVTKKHNELLSHDISATNLYSLLNTSVEFNADFYNKPIYIRD